MSGASLPTPTPAPTTTLTSDATDERRQLAARVLTDALLLGAVGDALLRAGALGANMAFWCLAIVTALFTLAKRRHDSVPSDARWLAIPAIALSLMFAWRDAESLAVFNTLALIGTFALLATAVARGSHAGVFGSRVRDVIQHVVEVGFGVVFGMLALNGQPMTYHPVFNVRRFGSASRDKFFLVIQARDPKFHLDEARSFLESLGPREVTDVPW
jgi:NADH:ubiquinone oxidoreductase subunit 6 (subunit J)